MEKPTRPHLLLSVVAIITALAGIYLIGAAIVEFVDQRYDRHVSVVPWMHPGIILGLLFLAIASYLEILRDLGAFVREGKGFFQDARRHLRAREVDSSSPAPPRD